MRNRSLISMILGENALEKGLRMGQGLGESVFVRGCAVVLVLLSIACVVAGALLLVFPDGDTALAAPVLFVGAIVASYLAIKSAIMASRIADTPREVEEEMRKEGRAPEPPTPQISDPVDLPELTDSGSKTIEGEIVRETEA